MEFFLVLMVLYDLSIGMEEISSGRVLMAKGRYGSQTIIVLLMVFLESTLGTIVVEEA